MFYIHTTPFGVFAMLSIVLETMMKATLAASADVHMSFSRIFVLVCKDMSTYDYIVKLRDKQLRGNRVDVESGEISPPKMQPIKVS